MESNEPVTNPFTPENEVNHTAEETSVNEGTTASVWTTTRVLKIIGLFFVSALFYIYNSMHVTKAIKKKEERKKELKELHSEMISLESDLTKESKQTEIAERLKETGLKELTYHPIKIVRDPKK